MKKLIMPLVVILIFMANIALAETAEEWIKKGDEAYIDGKDDEAAIKCYKKAISINPDDEMAHRSLGVIYHKKGMIDEEIVEFKKAISINPDDAGTHLRLGIAYDKKGMMDEAIAEFKKAIKITSDSPKKGMLNEAISKSNHATAHYNLGFVYFKKGMINEAISMYEKVIEINPDYAMAHYDLGRAYCVKKKVSLGGDYFYKAGLIFLKKGKKKWALKAYEALKLTKSEELQKKLFKKLYPDIK